MMHEVRSIPTAPRRVRLGPLLAHRWPLLLLGGLCMATGGLLAWMLFLAAGGKPSDQYRLDQGPTVSATATIVRVDDPLREGGQLVPWHDGVPRQTVHYTFRYRDQDHAGQSPTGIGGYLVGDAVAIELLPDEPNCNRIRGSQLHVKRAWLQPGSWLVGLVVPGALVLLGWLAGVFQLRQVLVHGDVSVGQVSAIAPVRWVLPPMLQVRFEFRDHRAQLRRSRHWVRQHSELGQRLLHQLHTGWFEPLPVLHDRRLPQWNRMLLPLDFLPPLSLTNSHRTRSS